MGCKKQPSSKQAINQPMHMTIPTRLATQMHEIQWPTSSLQPPWRFFIARRLQYLVLGLRQLTYNFLVLLSHVFLGGGTLACGSFSFDVFVVYFWQKRRGNNHTIMSSIIHTFGVGRSLHFKWEFHCWIFLVLVHPTIPHGLVILKVEHWLLVDIRWRLLNI